MILQDEWGDYWIELESGEFACITRDSQFLSRNEIFSSFGPLVEYKEVPQ